VGRTRSRVAPGTRPAPRTASTTGGGAQLGSAHSSVRSCVSAAAGLGGARPRRASCSRRAQGAGPSPATASRGRTGADLGIAAGRVRGTRSRWLGASVRSAAPAFVGSRAGACPGEARSRKHRLGLSTCEPAASDPTGALVERAGRPFLLGRSQDRGTRRAARAVMVGAFGVASTSARARVHMVVIAAGRAAAASRCLGATCPSAGSSARTRLDHLG
jgi:hypothetical protein